MFGITLNASCLLFCPLLNVILVEIHIVREDEHLFDMARSSL